jgi:hypothetical protein
MNGILSEPAGRDREPEEQERDEEWTATGMSGMPMIVTASNAQNGTNPRRMASPPSAESPVDWRGMS